MADIKPYTDQIAQAVYGEEVRSSIISALNKVNDDNSHYQDIKQEIAQAKDDVDEQVANFDAKVASCAEATSALENAISNATTAKNQLETMISNAVVAETMISSLNEANQTASENIAQLDAKNASAVQNINDLNDANFSSQEILTGVEDIKAYLGYVDEDIVGVQIDYKNKTFKRLAGAYDKQAGTDFDVFAMFGGRKRCNVADDGSIVAWYNDADYAEDGSMGQVMVYQPAFWYKVVPLVYDKNTTTGIGYHLRKANYYVSTKAKAGFKLHPAFYDANGNELDYILIGAYEGSIYDTSASAYLLLDEQVMDNANDKFCSIAGAKPASGLTQNLTRPNIETMAQNRGSDWHLENSKIASMEQLLCMIELGTMNTQTAIGQGVVSISDNNSYNCASLTGSTASIGNGTGRATETVNKKGGVQTTETADGKTSVSYRGVENDWGNIWKFIQGINIWGNGSMGGGQPYVAEGFTYNESKNTDPYHPVGFTLANANGYISAMGYGGEEYDWLLMPSEIGGTSALPVGDYTYITSNLSGYRIAQLGGAWSDLSTAGGFFWGLDNGVGGRHRNLSGRLVYVPTKAAVQAILDGDD